MKTQPIIINFTSDKEIQQHAYQVIVDSINDAFAAAKGDLEKMKNLNQLAKELKFATDTQIDSLTNGPIPFKEATLS